MTREVTTVAVVVAAALAAAAGIGAGAGAGAGTPTPGATAGVAATDGTAAAQGDDGFLTGTVRTAANDPVANATVRVVGPNRTLTFENATDADGRYTVRVPAGAGYRVEVIRAGFESASKRNVTVSSGETDRIDVTLFERLTVEAICIKPETNVAFVGDNVTVRVIAFAGTNLSSERVEGASVRLVPDDPAVRVVGPSVRTTNATGVATFVVTGDDVVDTTLRAELVDGGGEVRDGSIDVRASPMPGTFPNGVPGVGTAPAGDVDGDGVAEDVDGDGRVGFDDVVALLFADHDAIDADAGMRAALDHDGDGDVDFLDVVALLYEV